jgi:hypothetical protein
MWLVTAFLIAALLTAVHLVVMALASHALGATPSRVQIFMGPSLTLRAKAPEVRVGVLPFGGYVQHEPVAVPSPPAPLGAPYRSPADMRPPTMLETLGARVGTPRYVLILLSGNVALLALAVVLGGPSMLASAARAPLQLAWLATDHARAVEAVRGFARHPLDLALVAVLAAKLAAWNLLPLPSLNGGQILAAFVPPHVRDRARGPITAVYGLFALALFGLLIDALLRA